VDVVFAERNETYGWDPHQKPRTVQFADVDGSRVLAQSWRDSPTSREPRRNLRPRFAGRTETRVPALLAYKEFLAAYRDARRALLAGQRPLFPRGTYWLARFAAVPVVPLPVAPVPAT
jgi:hypothetical protein